MKPFFLGLDGSEISRSLMSQ